MIRMLFWTRLKVLLKRKEIIFWVFIFPILLASVEYFAFGKFIHSDPIDTIEIGCVAEYQINGTLKNVFEEADLNENKKLYHINEFETKQEALEALESDEILLIVYEENGVVSIDAKTSSTEITLTTSIIEKVNLINSTIKEAIASNQVAEIENITKNLTADVNYFIDQSTNKNATFYTVYFYALMAMACLYAAFFGVTVVSDMRADRSDLGIRISASVAHKYTLLMVHFLAALVLQFLSSCILFVYLAFILKVSLGSNIGLILLTLILGGISGLCIGMLTATFVKGEKKCDSILTVVVLSLSIFAGLMSIDVKILVDQYIPFINYINPACLITNSLYALYYYDTFNDYCLYTCLLSGISLVMIGFVLWKIRGEKYASL